MVLERKARYANRPGHEGAIMVITGKTLKAGDGGILQDLFAHQAIRAHRSEVIAHRRLGLGPECHEMRFAHCSLSVATGGYVTREISQCERAATK